MKNHMHLALSVTSLVVTTFLLVFVCLAWYSNNTTVHVNGVEGSVVDREQLVKNIDFYDVTLNNGVYTIGNIVEATTENKIPMGVYDPIGSERPERLMKITLAEEKNIELNCITNATSYLGGTILDSNGNFILKSSGNSLTSVINFYNVINFNTASNTFQIDQMQCFFDINTDKLTSSSLPLFSNSATEIYILLDYDSESIEHIYSLNIGNSALNPSDITLGYHISYSCDFYFTLEEVVQ